MKQMTLKKIAIAASAFACATLSSLEWSGQSVSLSVNKAEAQARVPIYGRGYAARALYVEPGTWYAVRAYYFNGPWSGNGYSYTGWADYAERNGIACTPGSAIKGGDGIMYACQ